MKTWKIILLIVVGLIVLFIGFVFYNSYQYSKFYDKAENLGSVRFGSEMFNQKLSTCSLTYSDNWEIRGLENNKCIINFNWNNDVDYKKGTITHNWISCSLPPEIYNQIEGSEWSELVDGIYCKK